MSGILLWASAFAIAAALAVGIVDVGTAATERARANAAADAAALAGAAAGQEAARETAQRNDAALVSFARNGEVFSVVVQVENATAAAHAERVRIAIDTR